MTRTRTRKYDSHQEGRSGCDHIATPYPVTETLTVYGGRAHWAGMFDLAVVLTEFNREPHWTYPDKKILFHPIPNYQPPTDPFAFAALISTLERYLREGARVHVGCHAGHGRTGTVFAALRKSLTGDDDAIAHVRANYCPHAVETAAQVAWLGRHWGLKPQAATRPRVE